MWQYLILILIPILLQPVIIKGRYICVKKTSQKNDFTLKLFWFILLFLLVFRREDIGSDLKTYNYIFQLISKNDWMFAINRSPEIGWNALNKLISIFTQDFRWIIVISAVLSTIFLYRAYIKYSTDSSLTIALFINMSCFVLLFSGLRQCISISLCMLAFELAMKKKPMLFLICVAVAMSFHISSFMILFIYPLCHARIKKKWLIFVIPMLIIIFLYNQPIFTFLGSILALFSDYDATIQMVGSYTMLIFLLILMLYSFIIPSEEQLDDVTIAMRNILLLSVVLQMFAPLHNIAMRMNYYFIVFIPLLIPRVISFRKKKLSQIAIISRYIMIIFFITYFFLTAPNDNVLMTFPYYFMWN